MMFTKCTNSHASHASRPCMFITGVSAIAFRLPMVAMLPRSR